MTSRPFLVRLISPFAVLLILIVAVCGAVIHQAGERATRSQQIDDLDRLTRLVRQWVPAANVAAIEGGAATARGRADRARLADAARLLATRITLIDGGGRVLFDTDVPAERMDNHNDRPEVAGGAARGHRQFRPQQPHPRRDFRLRGGIARPARPCRPGFAAQLPPALLGGAGRLRLDCGRRGRRRHR